MISFFYFLFIYTYIQWFTLSYKFAGDSLYDSAVRVRLHDFPAFALECFPNRNSLVYGEVYGIEQEASTIFRGTLRYEGTTNVWFLASTIPNASDYNFINLMLSCIRIAIYCEPQNF